MNKTLNTIVQFIDRKILCFDYFKALFLTIKNFGKEMLGSQAVSLSFFSTMAFAPLLAVVFSVSKGFGLEEHLMDLIHNSFGYNQDILNMMIEVAYNIIESSKGGIYGIISFLIFVWLVIWLLLCVENAFNIIWNVEGKRNMRKRFAANIVILIACPFVIIIFLSIFIIISQAMSNWRLTFPFMPDISQFVVWIIFWGITTVCFTAMYKYIPRIRVKLLPALKAAFLAALIFTAIQYFYVETQIFVSRVNKVYGVFAAIPLFMIWINMAWFTILMGSKFSFYLQELWISRKKTIN